jgi:hypothetical protein
MIIKSKTFLAVASLVALSLHSNAGAAEQHYTMADFYRVSKVDTHMHLHSTKPNFMHEAQRDHFRVLSINVDYADFPPIDEQQRVAEFMLHAYPKTFAFAATFPVKGYDQPEWQAATVKRIDDAVKAGAVAVKIWKNVGMDLRAADNSMVMIDDPHFAPVFEHLADIHIPLLGHQGEPKNCWLPVKDMTVKNDQEYFTAHPQYHMYLHPEMPSYEDQMRARDNMLAQHGRLQFVGMHMASLEWSVDELAAFLDRFPTAMIDVAARLGQLQYQAIRDPQKVRNFMIRYQDRIMYATDLEQDADAPVPDGKTAQAASACSKNPGCLSDGAFEKEARKVWLRDWRFFNSADVITVPELDAPVTGLALPKSVVDKLYRKNAERTFPTAWHGGAKSKS